MTLEYVLTAEDFTEYYYYTRSNLRKARLLIPGFLIAAIIVFLFITLFSKNETLKQDITRTIKWQHILFCLVYISIAFITRTKWYFKIWTKNIMKKGDNQDLLGKQRLILSEESIELANVFAQTKYSWNSIEKLVVDEKTLFMLQHGNSVLIIPKNIFLLQQELHDVQSLIERKLSEHKN
jgi:hypothetical protein